MGTFTPNINLYKPLHNEVGWDGQVNSNFDKIDTAIGSLEGGGVTSVFARSGAVIAVSGDYSFSLISGKAGLAQGGTNADLSATGGASQVLKQVSAGAPITVGQLASTDISGLSAIAASGKWSDIQNATANLALANAGFTTTFNQTSGVNWTWANTTTATVSTVNASPNLVLSANYWTGSASAADTWTLGSSLAAGSNTISTLSFTHAGSTGNPQISFFGGASEFLRIAPSLAGSPPAVRISGQITNQQITLQGNVSTSQASGVQLVNLATMTATAGTQTGVSLGLVTTPLGYAPASGNGAFIGVAINATAASSSSSGPVTGLQVNMLGNQSISGTFLLADFKNDFGSVFRIGTTGAIFPGGSTNSTITDNAGSTGGAGNVLTASSGGNGVIWAALASSQSWSGLSNATANLTLANAGFTTTFQQTSAVLWQWSNTTTASNATTNASPTHQFQANYWTGAASAADSWTLGTSLAAGTNGISTFTFAHTGSTGAGQISIPPQTTMSTPNIISTTSGASVGVNIGGSSSIPITLCSAAGATWLRCYAGTTAFGAIQSQVTAGFLSLDSLSTGPIMLRGPLAGNNNTTLNTSPGVILGQSDRSTAGFTATSGTQIGVSLGSTELASGNGFAQLNFLPTSGSANWIAGRVVTTVNQTGTSSGNYTALLVNVVETALKGTANKLLDLQSGTTGGTSVFSVTNKGTATIAGGQIVARSAKSANYTTLATDFVLTFTATATVTLDSGAAVAGTMYRVKLGTAAAGGSTLTLSPNNSKTIEGAATLAITTLGGSVDLVYDGSTNWEVF